MQEYKYIIIGGGIAGTTAAETIRKSDTEGSIAIISDEPHPLYSRVLLSKPKWVLGEQPFDNVWLKNEDWYTEHNVHLFKGIRATALDAGGKVVTLSDGDKLGYEKLLLATGAHSRQWNVKGVHDASGNTKEGLHYLRTVDDAKGLNAVAQGEPKHAVMVGSACVSFEIIEILLSQGFTVTEVMREKYFFEPQLSEEEVTPIENILEEKGVHIIRESEVEEVLGDKKVEGVRLHDGTEIACDFILPFIGVELPVEWVKEAGVATGKGIFANQFLETNVPNIWTAGDTTQCWDVMLEETVIMGNWMSARLQGEIAGKNMATGVREPFAQVSFHTSHGFGFQLGFTGDVRPEVFGKARTIVQYPLEEKNTFCRLVLMDGKLVGGTTVNRPDLMSTMTKIITNKIDLTDKLEDIKKGAIDLKSLI
jgi:NAD(P)H-nitrite reductase large subunit